MRHADRRGPHDRVERNYANLDVGPTSLRLPDPPRAAGLGVTPVIGGRRAFDGLSGELSEILEDERLEEGGGSLPAATEVLASLGT